MPKKAIRDLFSLAMLPKRRWKIVRGQTYVRWCSFLDDMKLTRSKGLRGIAAIFVMSSHMVLAFARYIVRPADGLHAHSSLLQKPFFRLVGQGPAWVALFFILSGFVQALKPVKLAKDGNIETALSNLGVSSFKRSFRLFLPATAATILSWFVCQLGGYETARNSDAYWLYTTSPTPSLCWTDAIDHLVYAIRTTWTYNPDNPYDQPHWALLYLLHGSMFVFTVLLVTINLKSRFRVSALVVCYFWSFNWGIKLGDRKWHPLEIALKPLTFVLP